MIGDIPDPRSAIYKTWVMLLNGYGYNWYRKDNQLRADDLLVRERAGHFIVEAAKAVQSQEAAYARKYLPASTRENPFPPEDKLATHALIRQQYQDLLALEARIRGLSVPPTDRIWQRHRTEVDVLEKLGQHDVQLVGLAQEVAAAAAKLDPEAWSHPERLAHGSSDRAASEGIPGGDGLEALTDNIRKVEQVITERTEFLLS